MNVFLWGPEIYRRGRPANASIESQLDELRDLARKEGVLIVREFVESMLAKSPGRPVFDNMVKEIERGHVEGIISPGTPTGWRVTNRLLDVYP